MKTFRKIGMALMAVLMSVNFAACSNDDDNFPSGAGNDIPKNTIRYQTTDGIIIRLENEDVFGGAELVSNTYSTTDGYGTMIFASEVTAIEGSAFRDEYTLSSITLPNSVVTIGSCAFEDCSGLTSITLPNSVTNIRNYAFRNCSRLTVVEIPNSVTNIGNGAFEGTVWYNDQPDGNVYAGKVLYKYKGEMAENTSIVIKDGTISIGERAFSSCTNLANIEIPNSVISISDEAFSYCKGLTSIEIPDGVTNIGNSAFCGCSGLKNVTIGNGVTTIGHSAFYNCGFINNITIGKSVTTIGHSAFNHPFTLSVMGSIVLNIYLLGETPPYAEGDIFQQSQYSYITLYVPTGSLKKYQNAEIWKNFKKIKEF